MRILSVRRRNDARCTQPTAAIAFKPGKGAFFPLDFFSIFHYFTQFGKLNINALCVRLERYICSARMNYSICWYMPMLERNRYRAIETEMEYECTRLNKIELRFYTSFIYYYWMFSSNQLLCIFRRISFSSELSLGSTKKVWLQMYKYPNITWIRMMIMMISAHAQQSIIHRDKWSMRLLNIIFIS